MTPTDSELIAHCVSGSQPEAFGLLVQRHQSAVRRFLLNLTRGNAALADDLAQETFIAAYKGLVRFRGESRLETWLLGIAYNQFRSARRRSDAWVPAEEASAREASVPSGARLTDLQQDLGYAMSKLNEDEQLALKLCFQFGLSHAEIAAAIGWPLGTVKSHIGRGKERLRELLSAWNTLT